MPEYALTAIIPFLCRTENLNHLMHLVKNVLIENDIQLIVVIDESEEHLPFNYFKDNLAFGRNLEVVKGNFGSPGRSRNAGLSLATGRWIAFWDSDDEICVDQFIKMITNAEKLNRNICIGEFETFLRGCGFHLKGHLEIVNEPIGKKYPKDPLDVYTENLFKDKKI